MKMLKGSPLGAVGTVRSFMNVVKDIDFEEVRDRAEQMPRMQVIAPTEDLANEAIASLFGDGNHQGASAESWNDRSTFDPALSDVVIVYDPDGQGLFDSVRKASGSRRSASNVFFLARQIDGGGNPAETVRAEAMEMLPELAPAFGRHYPTWRIAAVRAIVDQSSRANAQFALVSNIPAVIPLLGGLVSASADLLVLTKNQLMMCYKIAAAHGRDLTDHMAIVRELTPVVGAGFLWRTVAREAASFIPLAAGTIPKVGIAFAGTMTMGKAADFYYREGKGPNKSQLEQFKDQAKTMLDRLPIVGDDDEKKSIATPNEPKVLTPMAEKGNGKEDT